MIKKNSFYIAYKMMCHWAKFEILFMGGEEKKNVYGVWIFMFRERDLFDISADKMLQPMHSDILIWGKYNFKWNEHKIKQTSFIYLQALNCAQGRHHRRRRRCRRRTHLRYPMCWNIPEQDMEKQNDENGTNLAN